MRVYVINQAAQSERWLFQVDQLTRLGMLFERVEAVTTEELSPPTDDVYWHGWERMMSNPEKSAFCSHRRVWKKVAESGKPSLILEDDALLSKALPEFLRHLEGEKDFDHISLETRGRKKLLGKVLKSGRRRLLQDRTGAAAYVLSSSGAVKLLQRSSKHAALADATLCAAYELISYQAFPALAFQFDQCRHYAIQSPVRTVSGIRALGVKASGLHPPLFSQRINRIFSQLRMFGRVLCWLGRAEHTYVPIDSERFGISHLSNF